MPMSEPGGNQFLFMETDTSITFAKQLVEDYNSKYNTSFRLEQAYKLTECTEGEKGFENASWPHHDESGVYLILSDNDEVIYVGQTLCFGNRFYQYFADVNGKCVVRSEYWKKQPKSIVVIPVPDRNAKYERLSLEEYLIERLNPCDNTRGKRE